MKYAVTTAAILAAGSATAGGIDRSGQGIGALFETGNYAEFSYGSVDGDVTGVGTVFSGAPGTNTGDIAPRYSVISGAYKQNLNDKLDLALIIDQPFGASVEYPLTAYPVATSRADLSTTAITGLVKYRATDNFSVYGGLRYQTMKADASLPFVGGYTVNAESDGGLGYVVGAAYERPEIAMRVALTYNSSIKTSHATVETGGFPSPLPTTTEVETPSSINLDFQSGVAANTLVFGSIRHVSWGGFNISPTGYALSTGGGSLVSFSEDTTSYSLGVGRKLNDNWSIAATLGYEAAGSGFASNLAPTNGNRSLGLGATYTMDNVKVTMGVRKVQVGDADTSLNGVNAAANWTDNTATAFGLKVGYSF